MLPILLIPRKSQGVVYVIDPSSKETETELENFRLLIQSHFKDAMVPCTIVSAVKSKDRYIDVEKGEEIAKYLNPGQVTPYNEIEIEDNDAIMQTIIIPFVRTVMIYEFMHKPPSTVTSMFHCVSDLSNLDDPDALPPVVIRNSTLVNQKLKKRIQEGNQVEKLELTLIQEKNFRKNYFFNPISEIIAGLHKYVDITHRRSKNGSSSLNFNSLIHGDELSKNISLILQHMEKNIKSLDLVDEDELEVTMVLMGSETNTGVGEFRLPVLIPSTVISKTYHSGLIIGSWYLEWNSSELCIPRRVVTPSFQTSGLPLGKISKRKLDNIIGIVMNWNLNKFYSDCPEKENEGNGQTFVEELLYNLEIEIEYQGALADYLKTLKQRGTHGLVFESQDKTMRSSVRDSLQIVIQKTESFSCENTSSVRIEFFTHKQMDEFVSSMMKTFDASDITALESLFKSEISLLRLFDGCLWFQSHWNNFVNAGHDSTVCPFEGPYKYNKL
jgi:hypothetical protein